MNHDFQTRMYKKLILLFDPVHHFTQLSANHFNRMFSFVTTSSCQECTSGLVFKDEVTSEFTLLNISQVLLSLLSSYLLLQHEVQLHSHRIQLCY